jgi:hypothetical protein
MDQEMVYAGRQYPFFNREALNLIKEHFLDYFFPETNGFKWLKDWRNDNIKSVQNIDLIENHIVIDHKMYPAGTIIKDAKKSRHFNDLTSSSLYKPYYIYKHMVYWDAPIWYDREIGYAPVITIGAEAPCVCCGKHLNLDESTFLCGDCFKNVGDNSNVHLVRCDYCGSFFDSEEEGGYDEVTNRYYCGECADEVIMCDYCEGLYNPDQIYCDELGCLCENCRKDRRYD